MVNLMFTDHLTQNETQKTSYEDLLHFLYHQADDYGFLNSDQIKSLYDLEVPVSLHVEDFLDFYYWDLTKHRLIQLLEKNGNVSC